MRFALSMDMDNDAFREDTGPEVARILRDVASTVEHWNLEPGDSRFAYDSNGNKVGEWEVTEGPTCPLCDAPLTHEGAPCPNARLAAHAAYPVREQAANVWHTD